MASSRLQLLSPAKVNLSLAIGQPNPEAPFHPLVSLVAPLDWGDDLTVDWDPSGPAKTDLLINRDDLADPTTNLAVRAVEAFRRRWPFGGRVTLELTKRIPTGAGLGGGSSNASTVLQALAQLTGLTERSSSELSEVAAGLGSDCPLFLAGEPVIMRGRGEKIERLSPEHLNRLAGIRLQVVVPSFSINTAEAFGGLRSHPELYANLTDAETLLDSWKVGKADLESLLNNTFSSILFRKHLFYKALEKTLRDAGGPSPHLSGSGSACFFFLNPRFDEKQAKALLNDVLGPHGFAFAASLTIPYS